MNRPQNFYFFPRINSIIFFNLVIYLVSFFQHKKTFNMKTAFLGLSALLLSLNIFGRNENPIEGKIFFSNQPFTSSATNTKSSFTSADFIYGRMEIPSGTIKDAFKI